MAKIGQIELTTPEPNRWGDGSDGSATWSGNVARAGVYQFTTLTISANAHISVIGNSDGRTGARVNRGSPLERSLIIFATEKVTIGNNAIINANPDGTTIGNRKIGEFGNSVTTWGSYNSGSKKEYARGVMFSAATWRSSPSGWQQPSTHTSSSDNSTTEQYNATSNTGMINSGGGGGGSGQNGRRGTLGFASDGVSDFLKYTSNLGTTIGDAAAGYSRPAFGPGGGHGNNRDGFHGGHGVSVDANTKGILKNQFRYTSGLHLHTDGNYHNRDDFPIAYGGDGGPGGGNIRTTGGVGRYNRELVRIPLGGHGGGQIVIVAPDIVFPDAPVPANNGPIPEIAHGNSINWTSRPNYNSNAALLYACGQTRSPKTFGNDVPGSNAQSPSEEGIGGRLSGGTGQFHGMNGARNGDGSSGGGGGGAGGFVCIVYNTLSGHPTIRTYGGLGGTSGKAGNAGNDGGSGGRGGDGYMLIGWKARLQGDITWVKESPFGMRRGVLINSLGGADGGDIPANYDNSSGPREEQYDGYQWPSLLNGVYKVQNANGYQTLDYTSGGGPQEPADSGSIEVSGGSTYTPPDPPDSSSSSGTSGQQGGGGSGS